MTIDHRRVPTSQPAERAMPDYQDWPVVHFTGVDAWIYSHAGKLAAGQALARASC